MARPKFSAQPTATIGFDGQALASCRQAAEQHGRGGIQDVVLGLIHHLAPQDIPGFVLANSSMFSNQSGELIAMN